jgi:hypothetical protein
MGSGDAAMHQPPCLHHLLPDGGEHVLQHADHRLDMRWTDVQRHGTVMQRHTKHALLYGKRLQAMPHKRGLQRRNADMHERRVRRHLRLRNRMHRNVPSMQRE